MSRNRLAPIPTPIVQKNTRSSGGYVTFLEEGNTLPPHQKLYSLILTWNDIASVPVTDVYDVNEWNTFFQLNKNNSFELAGAKGNIVTLKTPHQISLADGLFSNINNPSSLLSIIDEGCIVSIGNNVFEACYNLTSINFPSLITAGDYCFSAYYLTSINLPKLQTAGIGCFIEFRGTSINFPSLITAGNYCFQDCYNLTSINFPSLITAGDYCFQDCTKLTSINMPLLQTAGNGCFYQLHNLISINLPSLITAGNSCFYECYKLISVDLPSLVTADDFCFYVDDYLNTTYTYNLPKLQSIEDFGFGTDSGGRALVIYTPSLLRLGSTVEYNGVFYVETDPIHPENNANTNVTITIPAALMTCNGGQPDGDIQYAQSRGICNVTTV